MPRKRVLPIFRKVSKILKVSIFVAKMRRPVIPRLVLFRKSQMLAKFKILRNKHYNYGFITDYEFSPSKTRPLIRYSRRKDQLFKFSHGSLQKMCSMLFLCRGLRAEGGDNAGQSLSLQLGALPAVDHEERVESGPLFKPLDWGDDQDDEEEEEEDSIDLRAERFIERFYEEMRMQRQASL